MQNGCFFRQNDCPLKNQYRRFLDDHDNYISDCDMFMLCASLGHLPIAWRLCSAAINNALSLCVSSWFNELVINANQSLSADSKATKIKNSNYDQ